MSVTPAPENCHSVGPVDAASRFVTTAWSKICGGCQAMPLLGYARTAVKCACSRFLHAQVSGLVPVRCLLHVGTGREGVSRGEEESFRCLFFSSCHSSIVVTTRAANTADMMLSASATTSTQLFIISS